MTLTYPSPEQSPCRSVLERPLGGQNLQGLALILSLGLALILDLGLGATATAEVGVSSRVAGSEDNRVDVVTVVVAGVDGVLVLEPRVGVQSAVGAEGNAVLGQDVAGEEVARLVAAVLLVVLRIPLTLGLASGGAEGGVVGVVVEQTHAVVCVIAVGQQGSVDGGLQALGSLEAIRLGCRPRLGGGLGVT